MRGAFRAPDAICPLRSYLRQRDELVGQRSRAVHHVQKALVQMNVQLDNVLKRHHGGDGAADRARHRLRASGTALVLAGFRDDPLQGSDAATIAASLEGNWRAEHLFALEQALARYERAAGRRSRTCEARIDAQLDGPARRRRGRPAGRQALAQGPRAEAVFRRKLERMLGVDLMSIPTIGVETALTVAAEVGQRTCRGSRPVGHFCSWLGLAPGTRISGDKRLKGAPGRRSNRLGQALRMAATSARRDKSSIGAAHRRRLARMDTAKAVKATAHQLARLIYAMLTRGEEYVARDIAEWEAERRERAIVNLQRQARRFDLALVPAGSP